LVVLVFAIALVPPLVGFAGLAGCNTILHLFCPGVNPALWREGRAGLLIHPVDALLDGLGVVVRVVHVVADDVGAFQLALVCAGECEVQPPAVAPYPELAVVPHQ
jgi:hypothetical protein